MHQDLVALIEADDQAKRLVADAERAQQLRRRAAEERRDDERARRQQQERDDRETLIRSIETSARQHAGEQLVARERARESRRRAVGRAVGAGLAAYLAVVGGDGRPPGREP